MAVVRYELDSCYHFIRQRHIIFPILNQRQIPTSSFVQQVELTITACQHVNLHDCDSNTFTLDNETPLLAEETARFNLDLLKNRDQASKFLGQMLTRLTLVPISKFDRVIDRIISYALSIINLYHNKGLSVLHLDSDICTRYTKHVMVEADLTRRALEESALELERRNHGMVPAKRSSVKTMLKRVRVVEGGGDEEECEKGEGRSIKKRRVSSDTNCVICLEEMKVGCYAMVMPCSHSFHVKCIEKWLSQSHYCPICRFEMPI